MNRLSHSDRSRVLACLVEGSSIRSTVLRMVIELGAACERLAAQKIIGLKS